MQTSQQPIMWVEKRNGERQPMDVSKIQLRLQKLKTDVDLYMKELDDTHPGLQVDVDRIATQTMKELYSGITTYEIDEHAAEVASNITDHPDYALFAGQILTSNIEANNRDTMSFAAYTRKANDFVDETTGTQSSLIHADIFTLAQKVGHIIDRKIDLRRNWLYDFFAMKTLIKGQYLLTVFKTIQDAGKKTRVRVPLETPQHMHMRVCLCLTNCNLKAAFELYDVVSTKHATFATPTLFHAGTPKASMISCFLLTVPDSIDGIFDSIKEAALISKGAGGVGVAIQDVRGTGAYIRGTNGTSNGIMPMLKVFNDTARYVDQGGGKRNGSFAIYAEPWHPDIEDFLKAKLPKADESRLIQDLFYALWLPDLFVKRVRAEYAADPSSPTYQPVMWSCIDPTIGRDLPDLIGDAFEARYTQLEAEGKYTRQIPIRDIIKWIYDSLNTTGGPYILNKDHCNRKSNQKNLGTIRQSNLCVAGETWILTREYGQVPIKSVVDQELHVWNGVEWSPTKPLMTSPKERLYQVVFQDGRSLTCTAYHGFFTGDKGEVVKAKDLQPGTILTSWVLPDGFTDGAVVESIELTDREEPVYCFSEKLRESGVFNEILTHNCSEIIEFSSKDETACCNLASIGLPSMVNRQTQTFDFQKLYSVVRIMTRYLNNVIDINHYPSPKAERSNMRHRPIGIGIQGLADTFALMGLPFDSEGAILLNKQISETMYFAALEESHALALQHGPYTSIDENGGAPIRHGQFHWDLCNMFDKAGVKPDPTLNWDWETLRRKVMQDGIRNSLLIALMPTASTSAIMGFQECFEPFMANAYMRKTKSGEFLQLNPYMVRNLIKAGCWSSAILKKILQNDGRLGGIDEIPLVLQALHKTTFEISLKTLTIMARDRGYFVDQSMSLNVYYRATDDTTTFVKYLCMSHAMGLKTSSYYTRRDRNNSTLRALRGTAKSETEIATATAPAAACPRRRPGDDAPSCVACEG